MTNSERRTNWQMMGDADSAPNQAPDRELNVHIETALADLHYKERFLSQGVFFDVYDLPAPEKEEGEAKAPRFVFKDFRSGDRTMKPKEQVALLQHQYYEWVALRHQLGPEFFPESHWIRADNFTENEAEAYFSRPAVTANTLLTFIEVQIDRQLGNRYSKDARNKGAYKRLMEKIGRAFVNKHVAEPFIGGILQERINGITFEQALERLPQDPAILERFKKNTQALITALRGYHSESNYTAFTWHSLRSDNVMVEVDDFGAITGRVVVVDANFTERPLKAWKEMVVCKLEQGIFEPLENALDLPSGREEEMRSHS